MTLSSKKNGARLDARIKKLGLFIRNSSMKQIVEEIKKRFFWGIFRIIEKLTPQSRRGDRFYWGLLFLFIHKRLPIKSAVLNDVCFQIGTSDELLNPLRVFVSDKEFLKIYVRAIVGEKYNVPTLGIIREVGAVEGYDFPERCCIKPTHASGLVIIRKQGEPVDRHAISSWFGLSQYKMFREVNYKTLAPKVIIEPLIFNKDNVEDYKIFCFNGAPKMIVVDVDRYINHRRKYFDTNWNELGFSTKVPKYDKPIAKPGNFDEMLDVAKKLSKAFSFVRIDLYSDGCNCLVGEITNIHDAAFARFYPPEAEFQASKIIFG